MTQRISVSIPDELYEKLQKFKNSINVSKLCQKALDGEIKKKEDFLNRIGKPKELTEIIERLKNERIDYEKIINDIARKDGIDWSKIAHFEDLQRAAFTAVDEVYEGHGLETYIDEYLRKKMEHTGKEYKGVFIYLETANPSIKISKVNAANVEMLYWYGWYEGVSEFWKAVKDQLFGRWESDA